MVHLCSESFYDHATSRFTAKAKLALCAQTLALATASLRGRGVRKKLNSPFISHFII
jgi:hypothetical protein